jgi:hypothetical protein
MVITRLTTYDHVNSDSNQSVRAMQSYLNNLPAQQIVIGCRVGTGVSRLDDDVGRMGRDNVHAQLQ